MCVEAFTTVTLPDGMLAQFSSCYLRHGHLLSRGTTCYRRLFHHLL